MEYVLKPNLGCPALVQVKNDEDITFDAVIAAYDFNLDLKSVLAGRLCLQQLSDTHKIIQQHNQPGGYNIYNHIPEFPDEMRNRIVPLEIVGVLPPVEYIDVANDPRFYEPVHDWVGEFGSGPENATRIRTWTWWDARALYQVTLRIPRDHITHVQLPQLFNLIQQIQISPTQFKRINFHAVYLHEKDWNTFSFIHITDTHIAMRYDTILSKLQGMIPEPKSYINWNKEFRKFISYVNTLHRNNLIDFIVLTGDIIDYIQNDALLLYYKYSELVDNFQGFHSFVVGFQYKNGIPPDEELEVPIFTCLGNHDYRRFAYSPIGNVEFDISSMVPIIGDAIDALGRVDIHQLTAYKELGLTEYEAHTYFEDRDYDQNDLIKWGAHTHKLARSYGLMINPDPNYIIRLGKHIIICLDTGPDTPDVSSTYDYIFGSIGLYGQAEKESMSNMIDSESPDSSSFTPGQIKLISANMSSAKGLAILAFHAPVVNYKNANVPERYLNSKRDPDYGFGVATFNFDRFTQIIQRNGGQDGHVNLILCGHTHNYQEYRVRRIAKDLYDFYHGLFSNQLDQESNKNQWWKNNLPLHIQTPSLHTGATQHKDFDMLRIVVKENKITHIEQLKVGTLVLRESLDFLSVILLDQQLDYSSWLSAYLVEEI